MNQSPKIAITLRSTEKQKLFNVILHNKQKMSILGFIIITCQYLILMIMIINGETIKKMLVKREVVQIDMVMDSLTSTFSLTLAWVI